MSLKDKLKRNDNTRKIIKKHMIKKEYLTDYLGFNKYFNTFINKNVSEDFIW